MNKATPTTVLLASVLLLASGPARAEEPASPAAAPSRTQCVEAHQRAQELKRKGQLVETQAELTTCSSAGCPGAIISDCGQWIADLEHTTPSMVFDVRLDGKQVSDFKVLVDQAVVADLSKAFKVNPGRHVVRVEMPGYDALEETVVLPEGQRMRLVAFEFKGKAPDAALTPAAAIPATPVDPVLTPSRPTPTVVYPLLGVAAAGFISFGVFAILGNSKTKDLEDECAPNCSDEQLDPVKTNYLIADISAGVGAAALVSAGIIYLARPTKLNSTTGSFSVGPTSARDLRSWSVAFRKSF